MLSSDPASQWGFVCDVNSQVGAVSVIQLAGDCGGEDGALLLLLGNVRHRPKVWACDLRRSMEWKRLTGRDF